MRTFAFVVLLASVVAVSPVHIAAAEISRAQAVARVRTILRNNTASCRINKVNSVTAASVRGGWRVTARLIMSASGRRLSETAVWIVSERNGAVAQNQLTAEIAIGCP